MAVLFPQRANSEDLLLADHTMFMFNIVNHLTVKLGLQRLNHRKNPTVPELGVERSTFADTLKQ